MVENKPPADLPDEIPASAPRRAGAGGRAGRRWTFPRSREQRGIQFKTGNRRRKEEGRKKERKGKRNMDSGRDFLEGTGLRNGRGEADWIKRREKP